MLLVGAAVLVAVCPNNPVLEAVVVVVPPNRPPLLAVVVVGVPNKPVVAADVVAAAEVVVVPPNRPPLLAVVVVGVPNKPVVAADVVAAAEVVVVPPNRPPLLAVVVVGVPNKPVVAVAVVAAAAVVVVPPNRPPLLAVVDPPPPNSPVAAVDDTALLPKSGVAVVAVEVAVVPNTEEDSFAAPRKEKDAAVLAVETAEPNTGVAVGVVVEGVGLLLKLKPLDGAVEPPNKEGVVLTDDETAAVLMSEGVGVDEDTVLSAFLLPAASEVVDDTAGAVLVEVVVSGTPLWAGALEDDTEVVVDFADSETAVLAEDEVDVTVLVFEEAEVVDPGVVDVVSAAAVELDDTVLASAVLVVLGFPLELKLGVAVPPKLNPVDAPLVENEEALSSEPPPTPPKLNPEDGAERESGPVLATPELDVALKLNPEGAALFAGVPKSEDVVAELKPILDEEPKEVVAPLDAPKLNPPDAVLEDGVPPKLNPEGVALVVAVLVASIFRRLLEVEEDAVLAVLAAVDGAAVLDIPVAPASLTRLPEGGAALTLFSPLLLVVVALGAVVDSLPN